MSNMQIDVLEPVFDPGQRRYKLVARATIIAFEFIDQADLAGSKFKANAILAGAKEKAIAKILISVVEAAEKIKKNMPQQPKGDNNDNGNSPGNNS